jgi:hypothetical protein
MQLSPTAAKRKVFMRVSMGGKAANADGAFAAWEGHASSRGFQ